MSLFQTLSIYKVEQDITSLDQLVDLLRIQSEGKYLVINGKSHKAQDKNIIVVGKNSRQGMLITLDPYEEGRQCAIIYTAPYTPNSILNWFLHNVKIFNLFFSRNIWGHSQIMQADIQKIILTHLKAKWIDARYGISMKLLTSKC